MNENLARKWIDNPEDDFRKAELLQDEDLEVLLKHYHMVANATAPFGLVYQTVHRDALWNMRKLETAIGIRMHVRLGK